MSEPAKQTVEVASDDLYEILKRTNKKNPKKEDVRALRKALKESDTLWRGVADLARVNQDHLISRITDGSTKLLEEALRHGIGVMRKELGYGESPPLERLLIEQVIACWLHFYRTQHTYINRTSQSIPITMADFWERKMNASQRRFLRAVESLARIRRLNGRQGVQINIAQQQVNVQ